MRSTTNTPSSSVKSIPMGRSSLRFLRRRSKITSSRRRDRVRAHRMCRFVVPAQRSRRSTCSVAPSPSWWAAMARNGRPPRKRRCTNAASRFACIAWGRTWRMTTSGASYIAFRTMARCLFGRTGLSVGAPPGLTMRQNARSRRRWTRSSAFRHPMRSETAGADQRHFNIRASCNPPSASRAPCLAAKPGNTVQNGSWRAPRSPRCSAPQADERTRL